MNAPTRLSVPCVFSDSAEQQERAQVIAAVAHDVRAPLQVLGLSLQSLRLRVQGREAQELVQAAESAFEEISAITGDLVDALQFGVSTESPREEGITLANLLSDVERRFRRRAAELDLELHVFPGRVHCVADRRYLQRILDNLVGNALKHSGASRVLVGARLRGYEALILEVLDNGCGIPEEEQALIFEERYRGKGAQRSNARGQGLGLWIVRRFTQTLGGRIQVRSVVGRGTRFTLEIPTYAMRRAPPVERLNTNGRELEGKLIALLDDDSESLRAMQICLEGLGANVFASSDELHFLARVTNFSSPPDLAVLDFNLGASTAERTLRTLRTRFGEQLRIVIVTAFPSDPRLEKVHSTVPLVIKPLSAADLQRILLIATRSGQPDNASGE